MPLKEKDQKAVDAYKKKVEGYVKSHAIGSRYYLNQLNRELMQYAVKAGTEDKAKTMGEILADGGELQKKLEAAFKKNLANMGVKGEYIEMLLQDLGVTLQDVREQFKGRTGSEFNSESIAGIVNQAESRLAQKLENASYDALGAIEEGTDAYHEARMHLAKMTGIDTQFPNMKDFKSHADTIQRFRQARMGDRLHQYAQAQYQSGAYDKKK